MSSIEQQATNQAELAWAAVDSLFTTGNFEQVVDTLKYYPVEENSYNNVLMLILLTILSGGTWFTVSMIPVFPAFTVIVGCIFVLKLTNDWIVSSPDWTLEFLMEQVYRRGLFYFITIWIILFRMGSDAIFNAVK